MGMIRGGFLSANDRRALIRLARDGLAEHRVARRANAVILLDEGWSCERVAEALLLDDDTVRDWQRVDGHDPFVRQMQGLSAGSEDADVWAGA